MKGTTGQRIELHQDNRCIVDRNWPAFSDPPLNWRISATVYSVASQNAKRLDSRGTAISCRAQGPVRDFRYADFCRCLVVASVLFRLQRNQLWTTQFPQQNVSNARRLFAQKKHDQEFDFRRVLTWNHLRCEVAIRGQNSADVV